MTHKCGKNPLPESRRDLFVANRSLLSIHVQVKLLCSAGQKPLQTNKEGVGCWLLRDYGETVSDGIPDDPAPAVWGWKKEELFQWRIILEWKHAETGVFDLRDVWSLFVYTT